MKKTIFLIIIILLFSQLNSFAAIDKIILKIGSPLAYRNGVIPIDGENKNIKPYISNNRTMLPLRFMAGQLGFNIDWNNDTKTVILSKEGKTLKTQLNKLELYVNDETVVMETAAEMVDGRIFMPLIYISRYFDKNVFYNNGAVLITAKDVIVDDITKSEALSISNIDLIDYVNDDTFRSITKLAEIRDYKNSCEIVDIKAFVRRFEFYSGKNIQIRAKVLQVIDYDSPNCIGLLLKSTRSSDDVSTILVICSSENKFITDQIIYIYGMPQGDTYTYDTYIGSRTVPYIFAKYVDK